MNTKKQNQVSRNHHYVPKLLLRRFCEKGESIHVTDKAPAHPRKKPVSIKNVGMEEYLYQWRKDTDKDQERQLFLLFLKNESVEALQKISQEVSYWQNYFLEHHMEEDMLKQLDDYFANNIFNRLLREEIDFLYEDLKLIKNNIPKEQINYDIINERISYKLFDFIALQFLRGDEIKESFISLESDKAKELFKRNNGQELNISSANLFYLYLIIHRRKISLSLMRRNYRPILLENKTNKKFITSDKPAVNSYSVKEFIQNGNLSLDNKTLSVEQKSNISEKRNKIMDEHAKDNLDEYYLPLSSTMALLITQKNYPNERIVNLSEDKVVEYNQIIRWHAKNQIYGKE